MKFRLLDLFCKAGGATRGYQLAGFEVHGVDIEPQPRYVGERFFRADALEYVAEHGREYDAIHASPPCQFHSPLRARHKHRDYPNLIPATREALVGTGLPYVIENVVGALRWMRNPVLLCASQFGNDMLRRHRLFESNVLLLRTPCDHSIYSPRFPALRSHMTAAGALSSVVGVYGQGRGASKDGELWSKAMGIDWMSQKELSQAIPPAYTEWIGTQLTWHLEGEETA